MTAQQPNVNLVRTAVEALGLPTEESAQLALRTQQIIAYETGVTGTADPLGGSYYIEGHTDSLEREAVDYIRRIDEMGGTLRAIEAGFIQAEVQNAAYEFQKEIEAGTRVIVGVNRFRMEGDRAEAVFRVDPAVEASQVGSVRELRASRDGMVWAERLRALESAARGDENLMPRILAAAEALATVGEISDCLRGVFGEFRDVG